MRNVGNFVLADTTLRTCSGEINNNNNKAKEQYIKRHDRVCAQLHFNICKETGGQLDKKQWYEYVPKSVEISQGGKVTILWDQ